MHSKGYDTWFVCVCVCVCVCVFVSLCVCLTHIFSDTVSLHIETKVLMALA